MRKQKNMRIERSLDAPHPTPFGFRKLIRRLASGRPGRGRAGNRYMTAPWWSFSVAITIHRKIDLGHPFSPPCSPGIWPCHGLVCPVYAVYVGPAGGASARIWAFDLSWNMVREATAHRSAGRDLVLQADVHHIPCRAASFDHIICFAAFPHFDDPKRALTELARVARRERISSSPIS